MNYWFWLYIILVPIIVFAVKPEAPRWQRVGRLLLIVPICYYLLMVAAGHDHQRLWAIYEACQNQFPDGGVQHHPECKILGYSTANFTAINLFGWIPGMVYIGFWELIWHIVYRQRTHIYKLEDKLVSYIFMLWAIAFILPILALGMYATYHRYLL